MSDTAIYRGPYLSELIKMYEVSKERGYEGTFNKFKYDLDFHPYKTLINPKDFMDITSHLKEGIGRLFANV